MFDIKGKIHNLQKILESGEKTFMLGGAIKGLFYPIPATNESDENYICEGYATGASIHEATNSSVYVAFNAGNLKPVAESLVEKYPGKNFIICADNDAFTVDQKGNFINVGLKKGFDLAWELNLKICYPTFNDTSKKPTDFNDLHQLEGLGAVHQQINSAKHGDKWLMEEIKADPGAPFEPENLRRLSNLKHNNPSQYMRLRTDLKRLKVPIRMLEDELKKATIQEDESIGSEQSRVAEKIAYGMEGKYAFNPESENWFVYKTGVWKQIFHQEFKTIVHHEIKNLVSGHTDNFLNGTVSLIKNEIPFDISRKGKFKHLLPFTNGLLDIKKREIIPHDPKYRPRNFYQKTYVFLDIIISSNR